MIRKYKPGDADRVIEIWRSASEIAHPFLSEDFLVKEENLIRYIYLSEVDSWVYVDEDNIAGFISMVENDIGGLFVDPAVQRKGVGSKMVNFVKGEYEFLTVDVFKENPIGCAFYLKYGFETTDEIVHEETGHMLYRMRFDNRSEKSRSR